MIGAEIQEGLLEILKSWPFLYTNRLTDMIMGCDELLYNALLVYKAMLWIVLTRRPYNLLNFHRTIDKLNFEVLFSYC